MSLIIRALNSSALFIAFNDLVLSCWRSSASQMTAQVSSRIIRLVPTRFLLVKPRRLVQPFWLVGLAVAALVVFG